MLIATTSKSVNLNSWPDGDLLHSYKPITGKIDGPIKSISWSKDGKWIVLVPNKGLVEVIAVSNSPKLLNSLQDIQQPTCAAFKNSSKKNIAVGTLAGQVLIYDMKNRNTRIKFPRTSSAIVKVEYCAKDSHLLASCENGEILLFSNSTCNLSASCKIPNSRTVSNFRCHPIKRNYIVAGSDEGIVAVWDINTSHIKSHVQAHAAKVTDVTFSPIRSDLLVSLGMDRKYCFYDTVSNSIVFEDYVDRAFTAVDFCPDGASIAMACLDGTIHSYDTRNMKEPKSKFLAQHSQIKQLLFQKGGEEEVTVQNQTSETKIEPYVSATEDQAPHASVGDSFVCMMTDVCGGETVDSVFIEKPKPKIEEDSFLDAMGGSNSSSMQQEVSMPASEVLRRVIDKRSSPFDVIRSKHIVSPITPLPNRLVAELKSDSHITPQQNLNLASKVILSQAITDPSKPTSSTPNIATTEILPFLSPIVAASTQTIEKPQLAIAHAALQPLDLQNLRLILKEEIKSEIETMKAELRYEFMDVMANMRRQFLDIQMSMVKEFIQLENLISKLRDDLTVDEGYGDHY